MPVVDGLYAAAYNGDPERRSVSHRLNDNLGIRLSKCAQCEGDSDRQQKLTLHSNSWADVCHVAWYRSLCAQLARLAFVYVPTWMREIELNRPKTFSSHRTTAMTTTPLRIDLMVPCMGIKRFTSQRRTPTTMRTSKS